MVTINMKRAVGVPKYFFTLILCGIDFRNCFSVHKLFNQNHREIYSTFYLSQQMLRKNIYTFTVVIILLYLFDAFSIECTRDQT